MRIVTIKERRENLIANALNFINRSKPVGEVGELRIISAEDLAVAVKALKILQVLINEKEEAT